MRHNYATLRFSAYCGMGFDLGDTCFRCDIGDLRKVAARRIRKARKAGQYVGVIEAGYEWEFETPDDAVMIGDGEGIMSLSVPDGGMADDAGDNESDEYYVDDEEEEEDAE